MKLPKRYDGKKLERKWRKLWRDSNIGEFDPNSSKPVYIIDTPPPYPTGAIHLGQALDYGLTDIIARTRRMMGFNVYYPQGYDTHGLPIEVKVEEKHGIAGVKAYDDPKTREKFIKLCHEWIFNKIDRMKKQFKNLGCSYDPKLEYITDTEEYIKKVQLSFLKLLKKDEIYRGKHPVIWCPRCRTAIAEAEVEYQQKMTKLNYIVFKTEEDEEVPIATTRPEFLPACLAVMVHPDDEKNNHLIGKKLKVPPNFERKVKVIGDKVVDPEYGTGVLMVCSFGDKEDIKNIKKYDLEPVELINKDGRITSAGGKYEGMDVREAREEIIEDLRKSSLLIKQEKINHKLGLCWRCDTPVEYIITKQWFLKALEHKEELLEIGKKIKWYPKFLYSRYMDWVDSLLWDWVLSRQRVFATPIPIWYCENGHLILPKEEDLPVNPPLEEPPVNECPECGSRNIKPEKDVLDTWFDSSLSALFISGWPDFKENLFPTSLRRQGTDIIRTWAFYTILRTYLLEEDVPWKETVMHGMVLGPNGRKMSKSRGNIVTPEEVIEEYNVDTLRQWVALAPLGENYAIDPKELKHSQRFLNKYLNIAKFASIHLEDFEKPEEVPELEVMDLWILTKLRLLLQEIKEKAKNYEMGSYLADLRDFVWHKFADYYLEMSKYRLYQNDSKSAKYTLYLTLNTVNQLLAPILIFLTEEIHSCIFKEHEGFESVHNMEWIDSEKVPFDEEAKKVGDLAIKIISLIRKYKTKKELSMREELSDVKIYVKSLKEKQRIEKAKKDIIETMHIQNLSIIRKDIVKDKGKIEVTPDIKISIS